MGPLRSSKKRPQTNRGERRVKEILSSRARGINGVACAVLSASTRAGKDNSAEASGRYSICRFISEFCDFPLRVFLA
jgi:hypothetical protein